MLKKNILAFCVLLGCSLAAIAQSDFGDALLATVGDEVITALDVQMRSAATEKKLQQQFSGDELRKRIIALRKQLLDDMIDRELVYLDFQKLDAKLPQAYVQSRIDEIVMGTTGGDQKKFEERLFTEGLTAKEFHEKVSKDIAVEMLLRERVSKGLQISDQQINKYFQDFPERFQTPIRYHLAVIQLKKDGRYLNRFDEVCGEISTKLKAGTPFADLAKEYSEGANASQGGDQGWLSQIDERLAKTVANMERAQASTSPVDFEKSVFFVQLIDYDKGGIPALTPELRQTIKKTLEQTEEQRRYDEYLRELHMRFPVRRMDLNN